MTALVSGICILAFLVLFYFLIWGLVLNIIFGLPKHRNIFKGCMTDKEFGVVLDEVFSNNTEISPHAYTISGGKYTVWVANGYFGFAINDVKDFSLKQRLKFFKKFNAVKKDLLKSKLEAKLHLKELSIKASKNGKLIYDRE